MTLTSVLLMVTAIVLAAAALWFLLPRRNLLSRSPGPRRIPEPTMHIPHVPAGTFLDAGHGWMRITGGGALAVGVDAFLAEALGPVDRVVLPTVGRWVNRGEPLLEIVVGNHHLALASPVEGEVQRVNDDLLERPSRLTEDPYGEGWAVSIWNRNHQSVIRPLMIGPVAVAFLLRELKHLIEFLPRSQRQGTPVLLADGGIPRRGVLHALGDHGWPLFQQEFLDAGRQARRAP